MKKEVSDRYWSRRQYERWFGANLSDLGCNLQGDGDITCQYATPEAIALCKDTSRVCSMTRTDQNDVQIYVKKP